MQCVRNGINVHCLDGSDRYIEVKLLETAFFLALLTCRQENSVSNSITMIYPVLSKFVRPVRQSDIFCECPTKIFRVPDQMSDRKYKNIYLVDETKQNARDHKGQGLGYLSSRCFCRHSWHFKLEMEYLFPLHD